MKEKIPLGIALVTLAIFIGFLMSRQDIKFPRRPSSISNFDECVAAGNPVMESYPEQCMTRDGRNFVNEKQDESDDVAMVERYVRVHISEIAPEQAVLGGTWYVTSVLVNPSLKTGSVSYEDGHIMGNANFSYTRNGDQIVITTIHKK